MDLGVIICLVVFGLLTLAGFILFCVDGYKQYASKSTGWKVFYYIYHFILGAPYLVMRGVLALADKIRNRTHKEIKVL